MRLDSPGGLSLEEGCESPEGPCLETILLFRKGGQRGKKMFSSNLQGFDFIYFFCEVKFMKF